MVKTAGMALAEWAERTPDAPFLIQPFGDELLQWSRRQGYEDAARLASGFLAMGFEPGDKVALLSKNCAEWVLVDVALSMAGLVSVPIYPTAGKDTITYVIEHSDARAVVVGKLDDPSIADAAIPAGLPRIGMRYNTVSDQRPLQELIDHSPPIADLARPEAGDPFTILYTSGSTGRPKGVVLSHGAYQYAVEATAEVLRCSRHDRVLSYLPLAHVVERTVAVGPAIWVGCPLYFTHSLETFPDDLQRARPTAFLSVPRLWVQFQGAVHRAIPPKRLAFLLSLPLVGKRVARRIRRKLGLDHSRVFGSGSAPISPETLRWYLKIGIEIGEGWGMTETAGMSCCNTPFRLERLGSIGEPMPGTEMKLSAEGEILIRSPALFTEYYKDPELTAESFAADGFFRTGDRGEWIEELGAYRVTGRVKELFKSAKGKYVAPVPIEGKIAADSSIEQVCVMGAGLRAPVGVVVLTEAARGRERDEVIASLDATLRQVNATLESHERVSHILVSNEPWTLENGMLTPTMKIRRSQIERRYEAEVTATPDQAIVWPR